MRPAANWSHRPRRLHRSLAVRVKSRPKVEQLESRNLPSAVSLVPMLHARPMVGPPNLVLTQSAFSPAQIRHAYGFDQITFTSGKKTVPGDGTGQTIAIVDAFDHPNIASDLAFFDQTYGLAAPPSFKKVDQYGGTDYPVVDGGWDLEISLDVEWAHAVAPKANIILVEAASANFADMLTAVDYARNLPTVSVVSMSWGAWEAEAGAFLDIATIDAFLTTPTGHQGITFVASAGDSGAAQAPEWPAASPYALAIGGTTLTRADDSGTYGSETAWTLGGGGIATWESEPSWQVPFQSTGKRTNPDVSYDGDPQTGFAVYDSVPYSDATGTSVGWFQVGGTSAGAPQWSALLAIVNQGRALLGKGTLNQAQQIVYTLSPADFHDVTTGTNGFPADTGYDLATGLGSPIASIVVRDLVRDNHVVTLPPGPVPVIPAVSALFDPLAVHETGVVRVFSATPTTIGTPVGGFVASAGRSAPRTGEALPSPRHVTLGVALLTGHTTPEAATPWSAEGLALPDASPDPVPAEMLPGDAGPVGALTGDGWSRALVIDSAFAEANSASLVESPGLADAPAESHAGAALAAALIGVGLATGSFREALAKESEFRERKPLTSVRSRV